MEIQAHLMSHTDKTVHQIAVCKDALCSGMQTALPAAVHAMTELLLTSTAAVQEDDPYAAMYPPIHTCCAVSHRANTQF